MWVLGWAQIMSTQTFTLEDPVKNNPEGCVVGSCHHLLFPRTYAERPPCTSSSGMIHSDSARNIATRGSQQHRDVSTKRKKDFQGCVEILSYQA